ncbi:MAG: hypothetical protein SW833_22200, partial [Cyanobacteriota bacterium]|nr:hypothetical protein [Cyanobacteriota bacterium]
FVVCRQRIFNGLLGGCAPTDKGRAFVDKERHGCLLGIGNWELVINLDWGAWQRMGNRINRTFPA